MSFGFSSLCLLLGFDCFKAFNQKQRKHIRVDTLECIHAVVCSCTYTRPKQLSETFFSIFCFVCDNKIKKNKHRAFHK